MGEHGHIERLRKYGLWMKVTVVTNECDTFVTPYPRSQVASEAMKKQLDVAMKIYQRH